MLCNNCGKEISDNDQVCPHCGCVAKNKETPKNTMAIVGLVFSFIIYLSIVGLIISVIALEKSKDINGAGKKPAIAGIIISIVSTILYIFVAFFGMALLGSALVVVI